MNKENDFRKISTLKLIRDIWSSLRKRRKSQIILLFILIFVSGGAEILTFSLIVPFLSIIQSPELAYEINLISQISKAFGIVEIDSAIKIMALAFVLTVLFATFIILLVVPALYMILEDILAPFPWQKEANEDEDEEIQIHLDTAELTK